MQEAGVPAHHISPDLGGFFGLGFDFGGMPGIYNFNLKQKKKEGDYSV